MGGILTDPYDYGFERDKGDGPALQAGRGAYVGQPIRSSGELTQSEAELIADEARRLGPTPRFTSARRKR